MAPIKLNCVVDGCAWVSQEQEFDLASVLVDKHVAAVHNLNRAAAMKNKFWLTKLKIFVICGIIGVIGIVLGLLYWKFFMTPEHPFIPGAYPPPNYGPPPPAAPAPVEPASDAGAGGDSGGDAWGDAVGDDAGGVVGGEAESLIKL